MVQGKLQIHSENILPIIKKWLYSEKDIFLRELISNACDALQKVKILQDRGLARAGEPPRIDVTIDKAAKTLTISDSGIGMDAEEIEKYLAQIAFSGAEEFIKAYQASDPFIGHFGLGFYSAYMVADTVEVNTRSYKPEAKPVLWKCDGSVTYDIEESGREKTGTDIILHLNTESLEYLDESHVRGLLARYSQFLPYPIYFNGAHINDSDPLWIKAAGECTKENYLAFFRKLYPFERDPLFWVHLNVDYPFHLKGILYFPHIDKNFDFKKTAVKLFSNRVFVSDDCKDILPEYLAILQGAIDSPDIPLNVSRSYLQVDKTVRGLANHISKKVADALLALFRGEKERFLASWPDIEVIIKFGAIEDEKFYERVKELLVWKTTCGTYLTAEEILAKGTTNNTIFYTNSETTDPHLLKLYEEKGIDVIIVPTPLDAAMISFIEKKISGLKFQRIDAQARDHILDPSKEKTLLDAEGKSEAGRIADFFRQSLSERIQVEAKSLGSGDIPGFIAISEEERRFRDYFMRMSQSAPRDLSASSTLIINTNSPLITKLTSLSHEKPDLAAEVARAVYELILLSQKEMEPEKLGGFITSSFTLLEKLAGQIKK
jgi:molecular chaperone HtpG